jgi:hypothetical protein
MIKIADSIKAFLPEQEAEFVSPEEPIFILTSSQLQEIVSKAVLEATEPLYREIAYDRQRIAKLEQKEPQPLQRDRGEILRALLAANDGKMLAKDARQKMRLDKATFSRLVKTQKVHIDTKEYYLDKKQRILILR